MLVVPKSFIPAAAEGSPVQGEAKKVATFVAVGQLPQVADNSTSL